jgi:hypothetical protein
VLDRNVLSRQQARELDEQLARHDDCTLGRNLHIERLERGHVAVDVGNRGDARDRHYGLPIRDAGQ